MFVVMMDEALNETPNCPLLVISISNLIPASKRD